MHPREKAAIFKGLKAEEAARLKEQVKYREILKSIENTPPSESLSANLDAIGWEEIEKRMEGQCWPPTSQDWLKSAGLEYYETPKQELLNQIADEDIRFHTHHYSELADHTLRMKATAHFFSLFGAIDNDAIQTFWAWTEYAKLKGMQKLNPTISETNF